MNRPGASIVIAGLALAAASFAATASPDWPSKPIRLIAPYAAGGAGDEAARTVAAGLSKALGQPVIVDNKPGAGGVIGADLVAKAAPDGYTLLAGANGTLTAPLIHARMPYAPADLVPVSGVSTAPSLLVVDVDTGVTDLRQLQAYARAHPQGIFFGTTGVGSTGHLAGGMIGASLGVPFSYVQYKGSGETNMALMAHQVQMISDVPNLSLVGLGQSGKVRMLAVASDRRMAQLPQVPTTAEAGFPDIRMTHWLGLFAPKGTPPAVLDKINAAVQAFITTPEERANQAARNTEPMVGDREHFTAFVDVETVRLGQLAKTLHIDAE